MEMISDAFKRGSSSPPKKKSCCTTQSLLPGGAAAFALRGAGAQPANSVVRNQTGQLVLAVAEASFPLVSVSVKAGIPPLPPLMTARRCSGCLAPAVCRPSTWKHLVSVTSAGRLSLSFPPSLSLSPSLPRFSTCVQFFSPPPPSSLSSALPPFLTL